MSYRKKKKKKNGRTDIIFFLLLKHDCNAALGLLLLNDGKLIKTSDMILHITLCNNMNGAQGFMIKLIHMSTYKLMEGHMILTLDEHILGNTFYS